MYDGRTQKTLWKIIYIMNQRIWKVIIISGIVIIFSGIIFTAQSRSIVGPNTSFMYDNPDWTLKGLVIIGAGFIIFSAGILIYYVTRT